MVDGWIANYCVEVCVYKRILGEYLENTWSQSLEEELKGPHSKQDKDV